MITSSDARTLEYKLRHNRFYITISVRCFWKVKMLFLKHSNIIEDFNGSFLIDPLEKKLKISFVWYSSRTAMHSWEFKLGADDKLTLHLSV